QQIADLQKENFNLKLRIYFLEENAKKYHNGEEQDIYQINIELKVELESLKKDLVDKQELL
ncbi:hypothetical protein HELRODRAFT_146976, partial [Helobdella robusta]|uniref:Centrosomin N-terminal motif 1 domain-containing protein n=1 Tax=Helobdella robusta TaxID=6412 RepID=T1EJW0_HELRO